MLSLIGNDYLEIFFMEEPWKNWKVPQDAIDWAKVQLDWEWQESQLWEEFNKLPEGKRAIAWVNRVRQLVEAEFFSPFDN